MSSKVKRDESLPNLSEEKSAKLKALMAKRQELMEKLRKIDQELMNPYDSGVHRGYDAERLSVASSGVQKLKESKGT